VLKKLLYRRWRSIKSSVETDYIQNALLFFTLVFSAAQESALFWEEQLPTELVSRFDCEPEGILKEMVNLYVLFERFQEISGVNFNNSDSFYALVRRTNAVASLDIARIEQTPITIIPRIKHKHELHIRSVGVSKDLPKSILSRHADVGELLVQDGADANEIRDQTRKQELRRCLLKERHMLLVHSSFGLFG
jgi:hypothetical protein